MAVCNGVARWATGLIGKKLVRLKLRSFDYTAMQLNQTNFKVD